MMIALTSLVPLEHTNGAHAHHNTSNVAQTRPYVCNLSGTTVDNLATDI